MPAKVDLPEKLSYLRVWHLAPIRREPSTPIQESLFLPPVGQMLKRLVKDMARRKTKAGQIRLLGKRYGLDEPQARKLYQRLVRYGRELYGYEMYRVNRHYYDWWETKGCEEYAAEYLAELDRRSEERKRQFWQAVAEGREHVVAAWTNDSRSKYNCCDYGGPMRGLAQCITRQRALELWEAGRLILEHGNPETLFNYTFREEGHGKKE